MKKQNKQNNFYIFLDIDHSLWDWDYYKSENNKGGLFNPKSLEALNYFLELLRERNYNTTIVVTSKSRNNISDAIVLLRAEGLDSTVPIDCTGGAKGSDSGANIIEYLKCHESGIVPSLSISDRFMAALYPKRVFDQYVVIDNRVDHLLPYIPKKHRIITNTVSGSLSKEMINLHINIENFSNFENQRLKV